MRLWAVRLVLIMGDVEKGCVNFVQAEDEQQAGELALLSECHFEPSWEDDDGSKQQVWDGGMYIYKVYSIKPVSVEQLVVLQELGIA